jgi:hypothetical protein
MRFSKRFKKDKKMKHNKKTILVSATTALAALGVAIGGTYALFTSAIENQVQVDAGKVKISEDVTLVSGASLDTALTPVGNVITFANGGTATLSSGKLVLSKIMPGDKVTFKVSPSNSSNVAIQYRTVISAKGTLMKALTVKQNDSTEAMSFPYWTSWTHVEAGASIGDDETFTVELPSDVGNTYQEASASITIALSAAQGNADVADFKIDTTAKTGLIRNIFGWVDFAKMVNADTSTFAGYSVSLASDLDFSECQFVSVAQTVTGFPGNSFSGTFDGKGHTLSNIDLDVRNAAGNSVYGTNSATGVFGTLAGSVSNLNVASSSFAGTHWVGGIVGYLGNGASISNCSVSNTSIVASVEPVDSSYDNGDEAGGIVGYAPANSTVDSCSVTTLSGEAYRDLGGIAGYSDGTLSNSTVTGATFVQDYSHAYKTLQGGYVQAVVGRGTPTLTSNTSSGVSLSYVVNGDSSYTPSLDAFFTDLAAINPASATLVISGDTTLTTYGGTHTYLTDTNLTIEASDTASGKITAIGAGVAPVGLSNGTLTFKNLTIADQSVSYAEGSWEYGYLEFAGKLDFESCDIVNAVFFEHDSAAVLNNCTLNSNKSKEYAAWVYAGSASFKSCAFSGPRGLKIHEDYGSDVTSVSVDSCTFTDITEKPGIAIGTLNAATVVSITNNTFTRCAAGKQSLYAYETNTDVTTFTWTYTGNVVSNS